MLEFFSFFIVILAGLFFSSFLGRFRIPWVIALIVTGFIIGPFGLNLFTIDPTIDFLARMGLIFLMFLSGLEVKLATFKQRRKEILRISLLNGGLPFLVGFFLLFFWGQGLLPSLLFGTIFISSSVAIIVPSLYANRLIGSKIGDSVMAAVVFQDILSLVLLSIILQAAELASGIPLVIIYFLLALIMIIIRWIVPRLRRFILYTKESKQDIFEQEFRFTLVILLAIIILFEFLGLHMIIGGFLAGLLLSDFIKSRRLKEKLHLIGYGIFIPIFFIIIGMNTDLSVFKEVSGTGLLLILVLVGSMGSKFIGGLFGARLAGFSLKEGLLTGSATIPQLTTTLAAVFVGFEAGLISQELVSIMVALSIITTFVGPFLIKMIMPGFPREELQPATADEPQEKAG